MTSVLNLGLTEIFELVYVPKEVKLELSQP
jgi:hypothetical protein